MQIEAMQPVNCGQSGDIPGVTMDAPHCMFVLSESCASDPVLGLLTGVVQACVAGKPPHMQQCSTQCTTHVKAAVLCA